MSNVLNRHLIQNTVVFAGVLFAHQWTDFTSLLFALIAYGVLAYFSYVVIHVSDLVNRERGEWDYIFLTLYGKFPKWMNWSFWGLLALCYIRPLFGLCITIYVILAFLHELFFAKQVILDVVSLSIGFSIRAVAGVEILYHVSLSPWLVACTFLLSLVVALGKRRNEMHRAYPESPSSQSCPQEYSIKLLDQMLAVVTSSTFLTYILYTISYRTVEMLGSTDLIFTIPFVLYGILRYLYLVNKQDLSSGSEIVILRDIPLMSNILLWLSVVILIIHLNK